MKTEFDYQIEELQKDQKTKEVFIHEGDSKRRMAFMTGDKAGIYRPYKLIERSGGEYNLICLQWWRIDNIPAKIAHLFRELKFYSYR